MSLWLKIEISAASSEAALISSRVFILLLIDKYVGDTKQTMDIKTNFFSIPMFWKNLWLCSVVFHLIIINNCIVLWGAELQFCK